MSKLSLLREFWRFMLSRKKWWLIPIFCVLLLLSVLILLSSSSGLSPFIYTLF